MDNSILEQLKAQNITVLVLTKQLKVSRGSIYQAINGGCSREVRVAIAKHIGKKPSELWDYNDLKVNKLDDALYLMDAAND